MSFSIPDMADLAETYYDQKERAWQALVRHATCADCDYYNPAPDKWVSNPCGWCSDGFEFVEADESVRDLGCESFDPRPGYVPYEPDCD